jgi:4-hydroxy-tetrahydrodipicolinate synthase
MNGPPRGLIIALVTPLDEEGRIDWASLERLIDRTMPLGDALLIAEGLAGEGLSLANAMRLDLLKGAIESLGGRKPLLICPTSDTVDETLGNVEALAQFSQKKSGKDLFWVDIPLWYHGNRKLPQLYQEWTKLTPWPILLYNNPDLIAKLGHSLKRTNIRTAVLKKIAENERVVGMIQAGKLKRTIAYQRAVRARRDFLFYDGDETRFLNQPSSSGVVSFGANLLPNEWKEIVSASLNFSEDPARSVLLLQQSQGLRELSEALRLHPAKSLKYALHRLGVITREKILDETSGALSNDEKEMGDFLREKFSLQIPPPML